MQVHGASQVHGAQPVRAPHAAGPAESSAAPGASSTGDRLEISDAGRIADRMAEIPDIRTERVEAIRAALVDGTYETDDKLDTAVERLLDEIA